MNPTPSLKPHRIETLALAVVVLSLPVLANAAVITAGNPVIYRVGNGGAALGTAATAVFLDEYTPAGTLVQSIAVPASGAGALTAVGNATTEGIMSRSQDGTRLVFTGYRKDAGGANPGADVPATTNRVIGLLDINGSATAATALTDPTGTIRSATTDSTASYYIGTSAAVRYVASPGPASTSVSIDARNSRQVQLTGNILFASNGSTTITGKVQHYGTLPTGTTTATPVATLGLTDAVNGIWFADLSASIAGDDTLYALSTVANQLLKYSFDGTNWLSNGSIAGGTASNLTGSGASLFLTSGSTLFGFTDNSGYNGALSGTLTTLATAGANTAFRGLGMFAVPEPSTGLLAAGLGLLALRRRR